MKIFDRNLIKQRHDQAASQFCNYDFLFEWTCKNFGQRLDDILKDFPRTLVIGRLNKKCAQSFLEKKNIKTLVSMELGSRLAYGTDELVLQADEEYLPFGKGTMDLIISLLSLHSVNDLPGTLIQINHSLKPDGLFLGALFGGQTLYELKECLMKAELQLSGGVSPRIFPFAYKQQLGALMQRAGLSLPVVDSEIITVTYPNLKKLLHDLRGMGESNTLIERSRTHATKALFALTEQIYKENYSDNKGLLQASFEIMFLTGWAPHQCQQQPLVPGSAKHSLAEALETTETPLKV